MLALATSVVSLLIQILPLITSSSSAIAPLLNTLTQLVPVITQEAVDLIPEVQNIIAALSANPAATADQLAALAALDAQIDNAFEAAATADGATSDAP